MFPSNRGPLLEEQSPRAESLRQKRDGKKLSKYQQMQSDYEERLVNFRSVTGEEKRVRVSVTDDVQEPIPMRVVRQSADFEPAKSIPIRAK